MKTETHRPPLQCRVTLSSLEYNDGTPVNESHILTWMGEVCIRADPDKDDQWKLYTPTKRWLWVEIGEIQILGRTPGSHTLREKLDNGEAFT